MGSTTDTVCRYFKLLVRQAAVFAMYMCINTFLPNAVAALVLLYGGTLVLSGYMSAGSLVSFMLYQQSLSSAFQVCTVAQGALL
jgi:ATP-binding cassette subfamily B (MDR/TAP) protein 9